MLIIRKGIGISVAQAAFTGAGNIVPGASAWWGLRGYTAAYSTGSNPAVDLVDQANANPITINILSNGKLDVASISAWVTANSVTTICVTKLYDQTGNVIHLIQTTLANMPVLILAGIGSLPVLTFANKFMSTSSFSLSPPSSFTVSLVAKNTGSSGGLVWLARDFSGGAPLDTDLKFSDDNTCDNNQTTGGGDNNNIAPATDNFWHSFNTVCNGTVSDNNVDGVPNAGVRADRGITTATPDFIMGALGAGLNPFGGTIAELGVWGATPFSGAQSINMSGNQHGYWGF